MALLDQLAGGYRFLPGIAPYSAGVVAQPGFEIVFVTLRQPIPYRQGFERVESFLQQRQRPIDALCAVALRSPQPFTFDGFATFNAEYAAVLQRWGLIVQGINPVARTNVAPVVNPPHEPALYGFAFTHPCDPKLSPTFVVAGAGELPEGVLARDGIVALGDTSPQGLTTKTRFVMGLMQSRLEGLGHDWSVATMINTYTVHSLAALLPTEILNRAASASVHGVHWHFARPPIVEIEFEMDLRGVRTELWLD